MRNYFTYPIGASCLTNGFELNSFAEHNIQRVYRHYHEFYELYLFIEGDAEFVIEERAVPLRPNTLLMLPPETMHSLRFLDGESAYRRTVLWIAPELFDRVSPERWDAPQELLAMGTDAAALEGLLALLDQEQSRLERDFSNYEGRETVYADYVRLILIQLCRMKDHAVAPSSFLRGTQAYIEAHVTGDLSAGAIARALHTGKSHLMRRFRAEAGVSLHQYVLKLRLQTARRLLSRGDTAAQAADLAGFSDYTTFYKAFVREFGMSPSRFREGFHVADGVKVKTGGANR